jgi:hypothetical protein
MALRTHNLHSGVLKKTTLVKSKRRFKVSKGHAKSFSASGASKRRLGRNRSSAVSNIQMALRTHNLPSGRLKK